MSLTPPDPVSRKGCALYSIYGVETKLIPAIQVMLSNSFVNSCPNKLLIVAASRSKLLVALSILTACPPDTLPDIYYLPIPTTDKMMAGRGCLDEFEVDWSSNMMQSFYSTPRSPPPSVSPAQIPSSSDETFSYGAGSSSSISSSSSRSSIVSHRYRQRAVPLSPSSPIKYLFDWTEFDREGGTNSVGERFRHLFYANLELPDDGEDDTEWRFERNLGKGGFGAAALFVRVNADQEVVDVSISYPNISSWT